MVTKKDLAVVLKRLRYEAQLTQIQLSAYTGISLPSIKRYETAQSVPAIGKFKTLMDFYKEVLRSGAEIKIAEEIYSSIKAPTITVTDKSKSSVKVDKGRFFYL